jgi:hypothetical protein
MVQACIVRLLRHTAHGRGRLRACPATVNTDTVQVFLDRCADTPAEDEHAVMALDGAGWHGATTLRVPPNVTLAPLPPSSPQPSRMERAWLYPRQRFFSLRLPQGEDAIVDAWCAIADDADRLRSLCPCPWIEKVIGQACRYDARPG